MPLKNSNDFSYLKFFSSFLGKKRGFFWGEKREWGEMGVEESTYC